MVNGSQQMATDPEQVVDHAVDRCEALQVGG